MLKMMASSTTTEVERYLDAHIYWGDSYLFQVTVPIHPEKEDNWKRLCEAVMEEADSAAMRHLFPRDLDSEEWCFSYSGTVCALVQ